jgi:hypothetical protein
MTANRSGWLLLIVLTAATSAATVQQAGAQQKDKKPATYTIDLPAKPDFSALDWAIGEWAGHIVDPKTHKENGTLHLTLAYALDKRFVRIGEDISLPASDASPAVNESWSGFIGPSASGQGFTLHAYSSTGFVTDYDVSATTTDLRFDPEGGPNPPPGWLFRRTITQIGPGYFRETVEAAPPGGAFFPYYSGKLTAVLKSPVTAPAGPAKP